MPFPGGDMQEEKNHSMIGNTRRDRRINRQKEEILQAAGSIFSEKGYASATIHDIAIKADIGDGTIYNYFPGKREILLTIAGKQTEAINQLFVSTEKVETPEDLVRIVQKSFDIMLEQSSYTRIMISEALVDDEFLNQYVLKRLRNVVLFTSAFIEERVKSHDFRPVDPELAARTFVAAFAGLILPALRGIAPSPSQKQRRKMAETLISLFAYGLLRERPKVEA
jgi:AcrR family transcriptional regulator